jgi:hypothetical protein
MLQPKIDHRENFLNEWFVTNGYDLRFELFESKNIVVLEAFRNDILEARLTEKLHNAQFTVADLMHKLFNIINNDMIR